jgi:hypothetical protein
MPPPLRAAEPQAAIHESNPFTVSAAAAAPEASPFWVAAMAPAPSTPLVTIPTAAHPPVAQPVAMPAVSRNLDDLPDLLDGRARSRRAVFIVFAVAILALAGTIAAAIASNYRAM